MAPQKNVTIEPGLFTRVEEEAQKQGRTPDDIANEATRRFLALRRLQDLQQYGEGRARELGLSEDDIPRLVAEARAEWRR